MAGFAAAVGDARGGGRPRKPRWPLLMTARRAFQDASLFAEVRRLVGQARCELERQVGEEAVDDPLQATSG